MSLEVQQLKTEAEPVNVCVFYCDSALCTSTFRRETAIYKDAYRDAKALGWKTEYYRGELMHYCPQHAQ